MSEGNDQHEAQATNDVKPKEEGGDGDGTLSIKVRDQHGGEVVFKVKRTTKMRRVLQAFCDRKGGTRGRCGLRTTGSGLKRI